MTKEKIKKLVEFFADYYGLPKNLALKQIETESNFNPYLISYAGAFGVAQFMPATYFEVVEKINNDDRIRYKIEDRPGYPVSEDEVIEFHLNAYGYYMAIEIPRLLKEFGYKDTWENRLRAYNAGIGNIKESYQFAETNQYVEKIIGSGRIDQYINTAGVGVGVISAGVVGLIYIISKLKK